MKKVLTKTKSLYYCHDGGRVEGPSPNMKGDCMDGDCSGLEGDCMDGDCSGLKGDCMDGDCSGLKGYLDAAGLTPGEHQKGVEITELIEE